MCLFYASHTGSSFLYVFYIREIDLAIGKLSMGAGGKKLRTIPVSGPVQMEFDNNQPYWNNQTYWNNQLDANVQNSNFVNNAALHAPTNPYPLPSGTSSNRTFSLERRSRRSL